jgi:hypothetical protein
MNNKEKRKKENKGNNFGHGTQYKKEPIKKRILIFFSFFSVVVLISLTSPSLNIR